jgi:sulfoxide reductase heme-binding subunit YedZ
MIAATTAEPTRPEDGRDFRDPEPIPQPGSSSARQPAARPRPPRSGPVYRGLPRPVRLVAWLVFLIGVGAVAGATLPGALREIGAVAALQPGKLTWYGVRAMGFLAYFALAGSVVYGLLLSTKLLDAIAHRPISFALHKDLALVGLGLAALHGILLLGDHTFAFTPLAILVPFASPYAPVAVGVGQLAFIVVAIVTGSFYVRRQIGQRSWRLIHYLTFLGFLGVAAHGVAAGTDSSAPWAFWTYLGTISAVVFLFTYRVVTAIGARRSAATAVIAPARVDRARGTVGESPAT